MANRTSFGRQTWVLLALCVCMVLSTLFSITYGKDSGVSIFSLWSPANAVAVSSDQQQTSSSRQLPDWRVVTDCSAYDSSCAAMKLTQGAYAQYPFRFPTKYEGDYDWKNLSEVPPLWMESLDATAPKEPVNETFVTSDISPGKVSTKVYDACVQRLTNTPHEQQLDDVLKQIQRHPELDMIAFTMADIHYTYDMIHEVFQMNDDIVGFQDAFFMVALDQGTLELGCRFGYPVIAGPGILAPENDDLRSKVQSIKFAVSYDLLKRNVSYLFYEMDIFFLQSPVPVLLKMEGDAISSVHQDNPWQPNIGCYAFRSNEATLEFFRLCCELLEQAPLTHDQHVFNNLWYLTMQTRDGKEFKFDGGWEPEAPATPTLEHPMHPEYWDSLAFAASAHPVVHEKTIAIHPLCGAPLRTPHGKKMMAKELGGWYGFKSNIEEQHNNNNHDGAPQAGYYLRTGKHRRYLVLDGRVLGGHSTVMELNYHDSRMASWSIAFLVLLARRTNRILILPKIVADRGMVFLWRSLDLESIENLVDFRETNFPVNRKSWYNETVPFRSVARTALGVSGEATKQWKLFAQLPGKEETHAWKVDVDNPIDAWVGYMASPEIHDAELLLVNPQFINVRAEHPLTNNPITKDRNPVVHEIREIFNYHLRWCGGVAQDAMNHWPAAASDAEADCYGRGKSWHEKTF